MASTVPTPTPTSSRALPSRPPPSLPRSLAPSPAEDIPVLAGPQDLVDEYLQLVTMRRAVDERLSYVRAELELAAAPSLRDDSPRGRFVSANGSVGARLMPTCVFDRAVVARELQRMGKLADVAILQGPGLARYLAKEPVVAARLGHHIRMRRSIMLMAGER